MATNVRIDWTAEPDANRRYWRVYRSQDGEQKGKLVAEVAPGDRAYIDRNLNAGTYYWYILAVSLTGTEEDWYGHRRQASKTIDYHEVNVVVKAAGPAPKVVPVLNVVNQGGVLPFQAKPVQQGAQKVKIEVIEGSSVEQGKIVATADVPSTNTPEQETATPIVLPATMPGLGSGEDKTLTLRYVSAEGRVPATTTTQVTVPYVDPPVHTSTTLSSVSGSTSTGLTSPAVTEGWEKGTYGIRLKQIPALTAMTAGSGWGTPASGRLAGLPTGARYVTSATVTFDNYDLGSEKEFSLECFDNAARTSEYSDLATMSISESAFYPMVPTEFPFSTQFEVSPLWASAMHRMDGRPMHPSEPPRWQVRVTSISATAGDWTDYVPMQMCRGRWVQTRMILNEPVGMSQLAVHDVQVRIWEAWSQLIDVSDTGQITATSASFSGDVVAARVLAATPITSVAGDGSLLTTDHFAICDGTIALAIPSASSVTGREYVVKQIGAAGTVTITPNSGNIDGAASRELTSQYEVVRLVSDGSNFWEV